jgi:predicted NUDIX family NTP pyrophosphohydrolase
MASQAMKKSAGILLYRRVAGELQVLLVHPGGPFWRRKDAGAWTIPKGEIDAGEDPLAAARRELAEETGVCHDGPFVALDPIRQKSGKLVLAWAAEGDCDAEAIRSTTFSMEWPPKSGRMEAFPEVDRAAWLDLASARDKIIAAQAPFLEQLPSVAVERKP